MTLPVSLGDIKKALKRAIDPSVERLVADAFERGANAQRTAAADHLALHARTAAPGDCFVFTVAAGLVAEMPLVTP